MIRVIRVSMRGRVPKSPDNRRSTVLIFIYCSYTGIIYRLIVLDYLLTVIQYILHDILGTNAW